MRVSTLLTTTTTLLTLSSARIIGIAVPSTIAPGDTISAIIETQNYIQSVADIAIAFGIAPGAGYPNSLGTLLRSTYLGPSESNIVTNITVPVPLPSSLAKGQALFSAALFSSYGASGDPTITSFNVSVVVQDETSEELKGSQGFTSVSAA